MYTLHLHERTQRFKVIERGTTYTPFHDGDMFMAHESKMFLFGVAYVLESESRALHTMHTCIGLSARFSAITASQLKVSLKENG